MKTLFDFMIDAVENAKAIDEIQRKEIEELQAENKRLRMQLNAHPCLTNRPKE